MSLINWSFIQSADSLIMKSIHCSPTYHRLVHCGSKCVYELEFLTIDCRHSASSPCFLMKDSHACGAQEACTFSHCSPICYPIGLQAELANYRLTEFILRGWNELRFIAGLIIGLTGTGIPVNPLSSNMAPWIFKVPHYTVNYTNRKFSCSPQWLYAFLLLQGRGTIKKLLPAKSGLLH